jgi:paraquat-inducible protein B
MTDSQTRADRSAKPAEPRIKARRRFSLVWVIPIVAGLVALWLGYKTLSEQGPTIRISFQTADGLEAGKTKVKYKNVELGMVDSIELSEDFSKIIVTARMHKEAEPHMNTGARFWVVRPRLDAAGVSGLGTLASGAYVQLDLGRGEPTHDFVGLEEPPVVGSDVPGKAFLLRAKALGSVGPGSPIFFRDLKVGEVLGYKLGGLGEPVTIHAFVRAPFDQYVHEGSRFWNASGISLSTDGGFKIEVESLQAVLAGGIAFDTPPTAQTGAPSPAGTTFTLYKDAADAADAALTRRVPLLVNFEGDVRGLEPGAPVQLRGLKVGKVLDVSLEFDTRDESVHVPVTIEIQPERLHRIGGPQKEQPGDVLAYLVSRGLRAQLQSASLITGQMVVALEFFPDAPPATVKLGGRYPEIPSMPTDLEKIEQSVTQVLGRIAALPLDEVVLEVNKTLKSIQTVANAPELMASLRSLDETLVATQRVAADAQSTMKRADALLASVDVAYGDGSPMQRDLDQLLSQLRDAVRSVGLLADYLEQHPEALMSGKADRGFE